MMNKMIVANLVHRPIRSLISIVAIALEVTLILLIVGLCYGILNDSRNPPRESELMSSSSLRGHPSWPVSAARRFPSKLPMCCARFRMSPP